MGNCVSCNSAQSGKYEVADVMEQTNTTNGDTVKTTECNGTNGTSSETKINGHANGEIKQNGTHSMNGTIDGEKGEIIQNGVDANGVVMESRDAAETSELKQNGIGHDQEIKVTAVATENVAVTADKEQESATAAAKIGENDADAKNGNEQQPAEDEGPVDESTAALRIQTKYRQYHAKVVVEEMKKDHEEHEHGTEAGTEGHDLPHPPESADGHVTVPSDDTTQPPPPAVAPVEAEHHVVEHTDEEKALAAVKIQAGLRGMRDRKYVKALKTQDHVIESQLPPPEQATTSDVTEQSLPAAPSSDVTEQAPAPSSSDVTDETPLPPPSTDAAPADAEAATSSDTASTSDAQ